MSQPDGHLATPLARTVDLGATWNASDADVAARLHPRYGEALARLPDGPSVFRGLPFALGSRAAGRRWLLLDDAVSIDLAPAVASAPGPVSHLAVAHFCDSWRGPDGERLPGTPVGWVLPIGEPLARYRLAFADGTSRTIVIRRRFQVCDGIIGWGFVPFEAVGHRDDEPVDWRGPHARQSAGRYPPAGHAGPLMLLPGSWGPAQTGVGDFVPTPDDDITYWLHAMPLERDAPPVRLELEPIRPGEAGGAVVVAGLTLFCGEASPLVAMPRRQVRIEGVGKARPEVDLGVVVRSLPAARADARPNDADAGPIGWGRPRSETGGADAPDADAAALVDIVATPDARIRLGDWAVPIADLDRTGVAERAGAVIRALPPAGVRVGVTIASAGEPTPARVRFVAGDGRYLAPLGHRDEVNPGLLEDTGADLLLGGDAYAYVPCDFEIDLPVGAVDIEVVKGFDHRPLRRRLTIEPETRTVALDLERAIDLRAAGWHTSDAHVHFLSPSTALLQAAAEDVAFVHVLATQLGDHATNVPDLASGPLRDPSGRHVVYVGTENRQNLLGHLALLGARRSVLPMASGGSPEGRIGAPVDELLAEWADRCRAEGGLVVAAHFPLPYAEVAADIVDGRIDAVELQVLAPGLDTPSVLEWYRFLNCGHRLPILGGTDKMSSEVPIGAIRTYARLDPDAAPTFEAWASAVRAGRTFATAGPVIELAVDGHEPGEVISLPSSGGRLEVRARARAAQAVIGSIEIVLNGRVVAREDAPTAADREAARELAVDTTLDVRAGAWIAARSRSEDLIHSAFATTMGAHTSPVYVEVADRPLFVVADAEAIADVVDGTARWLATMAVIGDPGRRARMVDRIRSVEATLRARIERSRREEP